MPDVHFFRPVDPPKGVNRMIAELQDSLRCPDFKRFYFAVAFAKVGPFLRLINEFEDWHVSKKEVHGILGIDFKGTSVQALVFARSIFSSVYVTHNPARTTFHPKLYFFHGDSIARVYIGSQNMTVGGVELNFEAGVRIDINLDTEKEIWDNAYSCWESLLPNNCESTLELTNKLLKYLIKNGYLIDEMITKTRRKKLGDKKIPENSSIFPVLYPSPPSSIHLPEKYMKKHIRRLTKDKKQAVPLLPSILTKAYQTLVIQIIPHHNGEIFLSKTALNQSPHFFGFPFTGKTTPKYEANPSYPMREPDPSVILTIYDKDATVIHQEVIPSLNMVFYVRKAEIRITINPTLAKSIPEYSILVMKLTDSDSEYDYEIDVYYPGSSMYDDYLTRCNQEMPSGGKAVPRKMGWL